MKELEASRLERMLIQHCFTESFTKSAHLIDQNMKINLLREFRAHLNFQFFDIRY